MELGERLPLAVQQKQHSSAVNHLHRMIIPSHGRNLPSSICIIFIASASASALSEYRDHHLPNEGIMIIIVPASGSCRDSCSHFMFNFCQPPFIQCCKLGGRYPEPCLDTHHAGSVRMVGVIFAVRGTIRPWLHEGHFAKKTRDPSLAAAAGY